MKTFKPEDLVFDIAKYEGYISVLIDEKDDDINDNFHNGNVSGLPEYLAIQDSSIWSVKSSKEHTIKSVKKDMIAAGFKYEDMNF